MNKRYTVEVKVTREGNDVIRPVYQVYGRTTASVRNEALERAWQAYTNIRSIEVEYVNG